MKGTRDLLRSTLPLFFLVVVTSSVHAGISNQEFAKCAAIEGDLARLDCFDQLAKRKKLDGPQSQQLNANNSGKWVVHSSINPIDDSKTVTMSLDADSGSSSYGAGVDLVIRCKSNKTEMYINWQDYLGRNTDVLTRIGDAKATTKGWSLSTDKKATFHPKGTIRFLLKMMESDKFLAQITPYSENPITAIFNTAGMKEAIKPLRETCEWTDDRLKRRANSPKKRIEAKLKELWKPPELLLYIYTDGLSVKAKMEAVSGPSSAVYIIQTALALAEKAANSYDGSRFSITVNGSSYRGKGAYSRKPFTSEELEGFTRKAIKYLKWEEGLYDLVIGPEIEPKFYGEDAEYRYQRGQIKSTGESIVIKILAAEK